MAIELQLLVWAAGLALVQMLVAAMGANRQIGLNRLAGNREALPELTGWAGRAKRAHLNMIENLVVFAVLVLVADAAEQLDDTTALGAQLFFWGRLAYAIVYVVGIPWVRTLVWGVSLAGMLLILRALFV